MTAQTRITNLAIMEVVDDITTTQSRTKLSDGKMPNSGSNPSQTEHWVRLSSIRMWSVRDAIDFQAIDRWHCAYPYCA